jgi:hypothetical protein
LLFLILITFQTFSDGKFSGERRCYVEGTVWSVKEKDLNRENCWSIFTDVYFVTICHYFQVKQ